MIGYLEMNLNKVDYKSIKYLYELCEESKQNDISLIRYLYNINCSNFEENYTVCKIIGIIKEKENKLFCIKSRNDFNQFVIEKVIDNRHSLKTLTDFFRKFIFENGEYICHLSQQEKISFMYERYFLADLGLIEIKNNLIIFNKNFSDLLPNKKIG